MNTHLIHTKSAEPGSHEPALGNWLVVPTCCRKSVAAGDDMTRPGFSACAAMDGLACFSLDHWRACLGFVEHVLHDRRQLFANAAIAFSRIGSSTVRHV